MELMYPFVIYIGVPILLCLIFVKLKRQNHYKYGKKIANTKYIKNEPYYKKALKKYKIYSWLIEGICALGILCLMVLVARPVKIETEDSKKYSIDIFLCMDVSTSVDELNKELVKSLKETVSSLKEERFGISIFNTSSVLLVPLTDDYDYVLESLDLIYKSIEVNNNTQTSSGDDYMYLKKYISSGTLVDNAIRGSSLIGDGLASCIYNFPELEEDRSRVIIFSTDNDLQGQEIVKLQEAAEIAKSKNITVYGICPTKTTETEKDELRQAVETTGGTLYDQASFNKVDDIVENIQKKEKSLIEEQKETRKIDKPQLPLVILTILLLILFILSKKVKI